MSAEAVLLDELSEQVGVVRGPSRSVLVDQARIDAFAATTLDEQWIHTDPERAGAAGLGNTIAHGFLTLSLLSTFMDELVVVRGAAHALNYGLNRVRFIRPVASGSRIHATVTITQVKPSAQHVDMVAAVQFVDQAGTLCAVAESLTRYLRESA
ncbi:MAG: MaoC family dehydratase [Beutenbergiaceae bacterium]